MSALVLVAVVFVLVVVRLVAGRARNNAAARTADLTAVQRPMAPWLARRDRGDSRWLRGREGGF